MTTAALLSFVKHLLDCMPGMSDDWYFRELKATVPPSEYLYSRWILLGEKARRG